MATIVNLNLGGSGGSVPTSYSLVLEAPYTEPSPYLLVLRSASDVVPISSTLIATENQDVVYIEGLVPAAVDPIASTLIATSKPDVVTLTAVNTPQELIATLITTENQDVIEFTGDGYVGIGVRRSTLISTEDQDIVELTSIFTEKWVAVLDSTEASDAAEGQANFVEYTGPGFINGVENADVVSGMVARQVYDVETVLDAQEAQDLVEITILTNRQESEFTEEVLLISESLTGVVISDVLRDVLIISETLGDGNLELLENLIITDTLSGALILQGALQDLLSFTESLGTVLHGPLADALVINETYTSTIIPAPLTDTLYFSESISSQLAVQGLLTDTLRFTEDLTATSYVDAVDGLLISETLSGLEIKAAPLLTDTLLISETLTTFITVYAPLLEDELIINESLSGQLVLVGVLSDTLIASDILLGQAAEVVHVVNAETGAVSTYTFTPVVKGMTQFQGKLYLATADGLFALDAEQDADGDIVWTLQTGFSNMGTDLLKRIQDVNFLARTEGDTTMQVISDRYGQKKEWNYRLPPTTRESYRDGVIKPGKGTQSVYYALGLQGIGPAEIDQLRVAVTTLSRRR